MVRFSVSAVVIALAFPLVLRGEKLSKPTADALKPSLALVKELYGDRHAKAKTREQFQALAKELVSVASTVDDPVKRFALLRVARDVAAQGGDGKMAFQIIDDLDRAYQVEAVRMKSSVLYSLSKKTQLKSDRRAIADEALALADQAIAQDDFEVADNLAELALGESRKVRDPRLIGAIVARQDEIDDLRKAYSKVDDFEARLEESPTDPEANLAVGMYRCLIKSDWENGLPMLALGSNAELKSLALKELGGVTKAEEQVVLGEGWWQQAEAHDATEKTAFRRRALYWFRRVIPNSDGLVQARAVKHFREFYEPHAKAFDTHKDAILLLGCDQFSLKRQQDKYYVGDGSALANHGVVHGAQLSREGKVGECFEFDGSDDSIEFPTLHKMLQANLTGLTIVSWIRPRVKKNNNGFVFDVGHHANNSITLNYINGDRMEFTMSVDNGGQIIAQGGCPIEKWHHVAAVWTGHEQVLYINGLRVSSSPTPKLTRLDSTSVGSKPVRLGICAKRGDGRMGGWYYAGRIDEVAVFNRALSEDEVAAIFCRGELGQSILPTRGR